MSQPDIDMFIKKLEARFKDINKDNKTGFFETLGGKIPGASSGQVSPYWTDIINQTLQNTINSRVSIITDAGGIFPPNLNKDDLLFDDEGKLLVPSWGRDQIIEARRDSIQKAETPGKSVEDEFNKLKSTFDEKVKNMEDLKRELDSLKGIVENLIRDYNMEKPGADIDINDIRINNNDLLNNLVQKNPKFKNIKGFIAWAVGNFNYQGKFPSRRNRFIEVRNTTQMIFFLQSLLVTPNNTHYEKFLLLPKIIDDKSITEIFKSLNVKNIKGGGQMGGGGGQADDIEIEVLAIIEELKKNKVGVFHAVYEFPKDDPLELAINNNIPTDKSGNEIKPTFIDANASWNIYQASGNDNDCLIHSFLTGTSPTFRRLGIGGKNPIATKFRANFANNILKQIPTEPKNVNGIDTVVLQGTLQTIEEIKARWLAKGFLEDTDITLLSNWYNMHVVSLCPNNSSLIHGKPILQAFGFPANNINKTIFIDNQDGQTHFQPVSINNSGESLFMIDTEYNAINAWIETLVPIHTQECTFKPGQLFQLDGDIYTFIEAFYEKTTNNCTSIVLAKLTEDQFNGILKDAAGEVNADVNKMNKTFKKYNLTNDTQNIKNLISEKKIKIICLVEKEKCNQDDPEYKDIDQLNKDVKLKYIMYNWSDDISPTLDGKEMKIVVPKIRDPGPTTPPPSDSTDSTKSGPPPPDFLTTTTAHSKKLDELKDRADAAKVAANDAAIRVKKYIDKNSADGSESQASIFAKQAKKAAEAAKEASNNQMRITVGRSNEEYVRYAETAAVNAETAAVNAETAADNAETAADNAETAAVNEPKPRSLADYIVTFKTKVKDDDKKNKLMKDTIPTKVDETNNTYIRLSNADKDATPAIRHAAIQDITTIINNWGSIEKQKYRAINKFANTITNWGNDIKPEIPTVTTDTSIFTPIRSLFTGMFTKKKHSGGGKSIYTDMEKLLSVYIGQIEQIDNLLVLTKSQLKDDKNANKDITQLEDSITELTDLKKIIEGNFTEVYRDYVKAINEVNKLKELKIAFEKQPNIGEKTIRESVISLRKLLYLLAYLSRVSNKPELYQNLIKDVFEMEDEKKIADVFINFIKKGTITEEYLDNVVNGDMVYAAYMQNKRMKRFLSLFKMGDDVDKKEFMDTFSTWCSGDSLIPPFEYMKYKLVQKQNSVDNTADTDICESVAELVKTKGTLHIPSFDVSIGTYGIDNKSDYETSSTYIESAGPSVFSDMQKERERRFEERQKKKQSGGHSTSVKNGVYRNKRIQYYKQDGISSTTRNVSLKKR